MRRSITSAVLAGGLVLAGFHVGRAEDIAPGVTYTLYNASGPNKVHVVAIDRLKSEYKLKVGWPQKKRYFTAKSRVSQTVALYDAPPGHDVLAATNGAYYDPVNIPNVIGTAASDGLIDEPPDVYDNNTDTFFFGPSRQGMIRSDVGHIPGTIQFTDGTTTTLNKYNIYLVPINNAYAYTPHWDTSTRTNFGSPSLACEVILTDVQSKMRGDKEIAGTVQSIKTGTAANNNTIPAGGMVVSAYGIPKTDIINKTQVGDRLRLRFPTSVWEYNNADMAITGIGWIIHNGAPYTSNWSVRPDGTPYTRDPMTVLAFNSSTIFMVVCDGRSAASVGMTFSEMATFLTGTLGATGAINLDGGGSSTMWVDGSIRNVPSDGSERSVTNCVMLVKETLVPSFPFSDAFPSTGRAANWDDKFTYNAVKAFSPPSPGGDGYVVEVGDPTGGAETMFRGDFADTDYLVEADIYCEYRPDVAGDGFERYGLFARDSGTAAFGLSSYGGGNCYALLYDSDTGRVQAGKFVNGTFTDLLTSPLYMPSTAWRRFRIACAGSQIKFSVDGTVIRDVSDATHVRGYFGIGYQEFFNNNSNIRFTRADNLTAAEYAGDPVQPGDFDKDGDVDLTDFARIQNCLLGQGIPQNDPLCLDTKMDDDVDVDGDDINLFIGCLSGADIPADPNCTSP